MIIRSDKERIMEKCIICQKEYEGYICYDCKTTVDIEDFLKNIKSPLKEFYRISLSTYSGKPIKTIRPYIYEVYDEIIDGLTKQQQNILKSMYLDASYKDYKYFDAEEKAKELRDADVDSTIINLLLAEYYITTRRYEIADELLAKVSDTEEKRKLLEKNEKQKANRDAGRKEFLPNPKENKEKAQNAYIEFMESIGFKIEMKKPKPKPIPWADYPEILEINNPNFDSFVAFDLETTGFSPKIDAIIDFGAVKVVNGEVVETKEFIFEELCKPYKKSINKNITELTGISPSMVEYSRDMWEVMKDFMDFVGDNILVGYNCIKFDAQFLRRAGRYAHTIVRNPIFDVMKYAQSQKDLLKIDNLKLGSLTEYFGIENKRAHRALPDAVATAKVFLKLKEKQ